MLALQRRWALGHEPIVEVPRPDGDDAAILPGRAGLPLASAGGLKGMRIVNLRHELLGRLEEILLDVQHGRIAYAVMGAGGFLGLGERFFAIPWAALVMDPQGECLVLDVARERFEKPAALVDVPDEFHPVPGWAEPAVQQPAWPRWE
jgi:hypothetical protein